VRVLIGFSRMLGEFYYLYVHIKLCVCVLIGFRRMLGEFYYF